MMYLFLLCKLFIVVDSETNETISGAKINGSYSDFNGNIVICDSIRNVSSIGYDGYKISGDTIKLNPVKF